MNTEFLVQLASEMRQTAEKNPVSKEVMKTGKLPEELIRRVDILGQEYQLQFSHDDLGQAKMIHLSFSRRDRVIPTTEIKVLLKALFFDEEPDVFEFPGMLGNYVVHFAKIIR
jgi:hypothetical protein